jgi:hypothetical protein
VGEAATGHGGRPSAFSEHLGEAVEERVVANTDDRSPELSWYG